MKEYQGEKAIISLTSWKARIATVGKTIYSLLKQCPGFHIVLVLSEEEFPKKEKELPKDLMLFIKNNLIEILWVYKNYKSFKKVLFTMDKYKDVPVISADDDCIYTCNYAEILYNKWLSNKNKNISFTREKSGVLWGYSTLHTPYRYGDVSKLLASINFCLSKGSTHDDLFYFLLNKKFKKTCFYSFNMSSSKICYFLHSNNSLTKERITKKINDKNIINESLKLI